MKIMQYLKNPKIWIIFSIIALITILSITLTNYLNRPKDHNATLEDLVIKDVEIKKEESLITGKIENVGSNVGGVVLKAKVYDGKDIVTIMRLITYFNDNNIGTFNAISSIKLEDSYNIEYELVEFFD